MLVKLKELDMKAIERALEEYKVRNVKVEKVVVPVDKVFELEPAPAPV